ncbi:ATP-binding protein [Eisenibacter elegans]|jgi:serine/threonine-protein kinase RsbW|uniref:ATP-binding protein n=1 Tax=Eisenibacter elegans TaxID=997 RepID=UPI00041C581B|nr:ATP-binding protein [Eisenibacter elegans]
MIHTYKVSCLKDNLRLIREFVNVVLQNFQLSELETNQLVLAVDEVCSNLIIYSHQCNPSVHIEINIRQSPDGQLVFEIIDYDGDSFDFAQYQEPNLDKIVKERRKGGMGLMLVNRIMDTVEVITGKQFHMWRLCKNIAAAPPQV